MKNVKYEPGKNGGAPKVDSKEFNKVGSQLMMATNSLSKKSYIDWFASVKDSVAESDFGAEETFRLANWLMPMLTKSGNTTELRVQGAASMLIYNAQSAINQIQDENKSADIQEFLKTNGFSEEILSKKINKVDALGVPSLAFPGAKDVTIKNIYKAGDNIADPLENLKQVSIFLKELSKFHKNLKTEDLKKKFVDLLFYCDPSQLGLMGNQKTPFAKSYSLLIRANAMILDLGGLGADGWSNIIKADGSGGADFADWLANSYDLLGSTDMKTMIDSLLENYDNTSINDLTVSKKAELIDKVGYDYSKHKFKDNSLLKRLYDLFANQDAAGTKKFQEFMDTFKAFTDKDMAPLHENALQYINNKEYWKESDVKVNAKTASEVGGTMEFTLEYSGIGDTESTASKQTTKVDVPENFNPYQTIVANQKDAAESDALKDKIDTSRKSGVILGKEQLSMDDEALKKYDGYGNTFGNVKHKYKVVWKNISDDKDKPYWVIADVQSFNDSGTQFYNIY
ncbi:hypothetical protein SHELI_v1c04910 [Spiroplasma helicoides]|uniref:Uncharacterized protein n=2 Tax=Spiroplasma helicoides TaxID=216938 RepID=A0A1B3SKI1_9MOLU|nr:hypothetical protein SHELI_v1c04910 [Spiroplasma helicoides]